MNNQTNNQMSKQKKKNWSVILLMAIGILFVTIAGSIFVSNTWKLMTETAKEICLSAVTIGIFFGSFFAMKNEKLAITGKALYYLGVLTSAFTSYMLVSIFDDSFQMSDYRTNCIKFSISVLLMMVEMAFIYFKQRNAFDVFIAYLLFGSMIISGALGLSFTYEAVLIIFSVEALLLSINQVLVANTAHAKKSSKVRSTILYLITMVTTSLGLFLDDLIQAWGEGEFGYVSLISFLLLAATMIGLAKNANTLSKILANVWTFVFLMSLSVDLHCNLTAIPNYYNAEVNFLLTVAFIILTRVIWHNKESQNNTVDSITYIIACLSGLSLLSHNVSSEELACVLTLGIVSILVLIWSSIINDKKYQILSGTILGLMAIYLTRSFWLSVAWWVYLLIAGIICIVIAVIKEKKSTEEDEYIQNFVAEVVDINDTDDNSSACSFGNIGNNANDLDFVNNKNND